MGDIVSFTITVSNPNSVEITGVGVTEPLPSQLAFLGASVSQGSFSYDIGTNTVTFRVGTLGAGQSATMSAQTQVNDKGQAVDVLRNIASISADGGLSAESATVTIRLNSSLSTGANDEIPGLIPVTGVGPGWREWMMIGLLGMVVALLPAAGWWAWRRIDPGRKH